MIEIAISLAVIGFALVAIIGILPYGMGVQRENREETIINQEYSILLNAIRNGERGLDDLANYVVAITNSQTWYPDGPGKPSTAVYWYTYTGSGVIGNPPSPTAPFPIINGSRIVGLLSTPKYYTPPGTRQTPHPGFYSNHVVATIRSMSGTAADKFPQKNPTAQEMAFAYRVTSEVVPFGYGTWLSGTVTNSNAWDQDLTNYAAYPPAAMSNLAWRARFDNYRYATNLQTDLNDVRLSFNWPSFPNGRLGDGHQSYRGVTASPVKVFYESWIQPPLSPVANYALYFVEPQTFVKVP